MSKITVIGAGSSPGCERPDDPWHFIRDRLIDVNKQKRLWRGHEDSSGAPFCSPTIVRSGDYDAASGSDIVIITSGSSPQGRTEPSGAGAGQRQHHQDIAPQITICRAGRHLYYRIEPGRRADVCVPQKFPAFPRPTSSAPAPSSTPAACSRRLQSASASARRMSTRTSTASTAIPPSCPSIPCAHREQPFCRFLWASIPRL